uniref:Uncharacterized protein n=1 Tax=Rhizophora mucronata TaxID=61149 RepID=A0A2P2NQG3_RHIMU
MFYKQGRPKCGGFCPVLFFCIVLTINYSLLKWHVHSDCFYTLFDSMM